ncbi:uncharacterized protein LOC112346410 [Selaginella moellendorffii]|uniref:uncharacterized protein LOC112346410 n=1 Tax=Selaginella moellendorffii TaxID=88036 RepID=UPI000D1C8B26|nr:uncharacterized protein LOC112346410 [Selaginella moellendorffii]|eukprot:XP_024531122.1 uncharacterized protein LOC112346410 [Selaginella moellendorffii]
MVNLGVSSCFKVTTRFSPFQLVYGQEALLPVELEVPALRTAVEHAMDWDGAIQQRLNELERLDETRLLAFQAREALQKRRKKWHDDHIRERKFAIGDLVLLYDSKFWKRPGKLKIRWLGPYVVVNVNDNGSVQVADLSGNLLPTRINGFRLKKYHPRSNDETAGAERESNVLEPSESESRMTRAEAS